MSDIGVIAQKTPAGGDCGARLFLTNRVPWNCWPLCVRALTRHFSGAAFLKQLNDTLRIRIPGTEAPREPVSTALGNLLAVDDDVKLATLSRGNRCGDTKPFLYQGRETRDLGFVVLSGRARHYLYVHLLLQVFGAVANMPRQTFL